MQTHRSLLHWAMFYTNDLQITLQDRLTLLHSWSMPSCLHHLWSAPLNGAVLLPFDVRVKVRECLQKAQTGEPLCSSVRQLKGLTACQT
jgi:hypothetical protein